MTTLSKPPADGVPSDATPSRANPSRATPSRATPSRATPSRATMREVAALAGVSLKTVSRVVNGESGVSDELAERVAKAAAELDYRPNLTASNLRRADQRTRTLGLVVEDVANEFFASVHRGIEDRARERGVAVVASSVGREPELELDIVSALANRRVDGLVLVPTARDQSYLTGELRRGWPVVCLDRLPRGVEVDSVVTDNRESAVRGVRHLLELGHSRIAFVGGHSLLSTAQDRYAGYLEAMAEAGHAVRPEWVHRDVQDSADAERVVESLMDLTHQPTAIFSAQNLITMGAVRALRARRMQYDVALLGFDDFTLADMLEPSVTVVAQDPRAMGAMAADLLFRRMDDPSLPAHALIVPSRLVIRGSSIPAKAE